MCWSTQAPAPCRTAAPRPIPIFPSFVLLAPAARGKLNDMLAKGFAGFLVKPVRQAAFIERFRTQLEVTSEPQPAPAVKQQAAQIVRGFKVLLAEDNPVNALLTRELLRRRGHKVREVTTAMPPSRR